MKKGLLFITVLLMLAPLLQADFRVDLPFSHINKGTGLSDDMVFSLFQDSSGYIWVGTSNGLNRYDGYKLKKFYHRADDPLSLAHNTVTSICEDKDGNLWFGTFGGGVSKFIPASGSFLNYSLSTETGGPENTTLVNHILSDSKNRLWISTRERGIFLLDPVTSRVKNLSNITGSNSSETTSSVMSATEDSNGTIWIASWGSGLWKYVEENGILGKQVTRNSAGAPVGQYIHTILEDAEKNLWLGTRDQGIIRFNREKGDSRTLGLEKTRNVNMTGKSINTIFWDPENHNLIWIGTVNGLYVYRIHENKFLAYKRNDPRWRLSNNYVWSIIRDRSGLLWIGTIGGGVNLEKRVNNYFENYNSTAPDGYRLSSNVIRSIYSDTNDPDSLWVGTTGGGLNRIDLRSGRINPFVFDIRELGSITPRYVNAILADPGTTGALFLGTGTGLYRYHIGTNRFEKLASKQKEFKSFNSLQVTGLLITRSHPGVLWIGTQGSGLYRMELNDMSLKNYFPGDKGPTNRENHGINTLKGSLSSPEIIWVGTNSGLGQFNTETGQFRMNTLRNPEASGERTMVLSIHESMNSPGILWLGTWGSGLFRFDTESGSFTRYTEKDGLPNPFVVSIAEEPEGRLWLGTQAGLSSYIIKSGLFRNFDYHEGLQNSLFRTNVIFKNSDKRIFAGGSKGIDHFVPGNLRTNTVVPPVVLTELKVFGSSELPGMEDILKEDISVARRIQLPHNYNTVTLHFAALDYTSPGKNQFACRIKGLDSRWKNLGTRNHITYSDLKPGEYTFTVKGANSDSVWNEEGRTLTIVVRSSFTRTFLYKVIIGIILVTLILLVLYLWRKLRKISYSTTPTVEQLMGRHNISNREGEIIRLILQGKSNKEIEEELFISLGTVKNHLYRIYQKLNIHSRAQLISLFTTRNGK